MHSVAVETVRPADVLRKAARGEDPIASATMDLRSAAHDSGSVLTGVEVKEDYSVS
jgi:hypothetical protein